MDVKIGDKIIKNAKLPKNVKKAWIKSLRSGNYKQGIETLHNEEENTWCCLGVLCNTIHPKTDLTSWGYIEMELAKKARKIPAIMKGDSIDNSLVKKLTQFNDKKKKSFKYIASYIERYL